jgi:hypothetical protein
MRVDLEIPADAPESQPAGWSQQATFSIALVSQTDEKWNFRLCTKTHTFNANTLECRGYCMYHPTGFLNDNTCHGHIVNDTLIFKCDMTNISSNASTAAAAPTARVAVPAGTGGLL